MTDGVNSTKGDHTIGDLCLQLEGGREIVTDDVLGTLQIHLDRGMRVLKIVLML